MVLSLTIALVGETEGEGAKVVAVILPPQAEVVMNRSVAREGYGAGERGSLHRASQADPLLQLVDAAELCTEVYPLVVVAQVIKELHQPLLPLPPEAEVEVSRPRAGIIKEILGGRSIPCIGIRRLETVGKGGQRTPGERKVSSEAATIRAILRSDPPSSPLAVGQQRAVHDDHPAEGIAAVANRLCPLENGDHTGMPRVESGTEVDIPLLRLLPHAVSDDKDPISRETVDHRHSLATTGADAAYPLDHRQRIGQVLPDRPVEVIGGDHLADHRSLLGRPLRHHLDGAQKFARRVHINGGIPQVRHRNRKGIIADETADEPIPTLPRIHRDKGETCAIREISVTTQPEDHTRQRLSVLRIEDGDPPRLSRRRQGQEREQCPQEGTPHAVI